VERHRVCRQPRRRPRSFARLKATWSKDAGDAVDRLERDIEALLAHYAFPPEHWDALRTTNPIERVNKEFKRRSKAMEVVSPNGLKPLLAFTAIRLEYGWVQTQCRPPSPRTRSADSSGASSANVNSKRSPSPCSISSRHKKLYTTTASRLRALRHPAPGTDWCVSRAVASGQTGRHAQSGGGTTDLGAHYAVLDDADGQASPCWIE
jgi:hypothetical protein